MMAFLNIKNNWALDGKILATFGFVLYKVRRLRVLPDPTWINSGTTVGGLNGVASFCFSRISISLNVTWSTVAFKISLTVGLSVYLITCITVAFSLIALLLAFRKVWTPFIATGLKQIAPLLKQIALCHEVHRLNPDHIGT